MILLDTDHLSVHAFPDSPRFARLSTRLKQSDESFGTTIVCIEEQLRGWLAAVKGKKEIDDQIPIYERLARMWDYFRSWAIAPLDASATMRFKNFANRRSESARKTSRSRQSP